MDDLPKVAAQQCPTGSRTNDFTVATGTPYSLYHFATLSVVCNMHYAYTFKDVYDSKFGRLPRSPPRGPLFSTALTLAIYVGIAYGVKIWDRNWFRVLKNEPPRCQQQATGLIPRPKYGQQICRNYIVLYSLVAYACTFWHKAKII